MIRLVRSVITLRRLRWPKTSTRYSINRNICGIFSSELRLSTNDSACPPAQTTAPILRHHQLFCGQVQCQSSAAGYRIAFDRWTVFPINVLLSQSALHIFWLLASSLIVLRLPNTHEWMDLDNRSPATAFTMRHAMFIGALSRQQAPSAWIFPSGESSDSSPGMRPPAANAIFQPHCRWQGIRYLDIGDTFLSAPQSA